MKSEWLMVVALLMSCAGNVPEQKASAPVEKAHSTGEAMAISAVEFADGGAIPARFTCEGEDAAPTLRISGVPPEAVSLALIVDDPDAPDPAAPEMVWVHQVLFNIPKETGELKAGAVQESAVSGRNDWGQPGYRGPCPPIGRHRYYFRLYALDTALDLESPTRAELEQAMQGHVLATAQWMGTYMKSQQ